MKTIAEVVQEMSVESRLKIINDYDEFVKSGWIGDCMLRETATAWVAERLGCESNITFWMAEVANECFKKFARDYISLKYK